MKDKDLKESLSALLDGQAGELEFRRVLNHLDENPDLKQAWNHYSLMGQLMKDGETGFESVDLTSRIRNSIEQDEFDKNIGLETDESGAIETPLSSSTGPGSSNSNSSEFVLSDSTNFDSAKKLEGGDDKRSMGQISASKLVFKQFAVAASVALVAVFGVQQFNLQDNEDSAQQELVKLDNALDVKGQLEQQGLDEESLAIAQQKLSDYLIQHAENASMNSGNGMLNFARVVSYQPEGFISQSGDEPPIELESSSLKGEEKSTEGKIEKDTRSNAQEAE